MLLTIENDLTLYIHFMRIQVQKTYTLSELQPGTTYDIRIRAHNNAGSSVAEYKITTLQPHISTTLSSLDIDQYIPQHPSVYSDMKLIVPLVLSSFAIIAAAGAVFYCFRKRKSNIRNLSRPNINHAKEFI